MKRYLLALLLVLFMIIPPISAWNLNTLDEEPISSSSFMGLDYANKKTEDMISAATASTFPEFFIQKYKTTPAGFFYPTYVDHFKRSIMYVFSRTNEENSGRNGYAYLANHLYVFDDVTLKNYYGIFKGSQKDSFYGEFAMLILPLDGKYDPSDMQWNPDAVYFKYDKLELGWGNRDTVLEPTTIPTVHLKPGVYLVGAGINHYVSWDPNSGLRFSGWNPSVTSGVYTYSNEPLSMDEIKEKNGINGVDFDNANMRVFCEAIGQPYESGVPIGHRCCGDDIEGDDNYGYTDTYTGTSYLCQVEEGIGHWITDDEGDAFTNFCRDLGTINQQEAVFNHAVNPDVTFDYMKETTNGSDACCGDDFAKECEFDSTQQNNIQSCESYFDAYDSCPYTYHCQATYECQPTTQENFFSCSDFFQESSGCNEYAPSSCYSSYGSSTCQGYFNCQDLQPNCYFVYDQDTNQNLCESVITRCTVQEDELFTVSTCEAQSSYSCSNLPYCTVLDDQANQDLYDVVDEMYFCSNDFDPQTSISYKDAVNWKWWSASNQEFKIHLGDVDYLSNTQGWYSCDPSNAEGNNLVLGHLQPLTPPYNVADDYCSNKVPGLQVFDDGTANYIFTSSTVCGFLEDGEATFARVLGENGIDTSYADNLIGCCSAEETTTSISAETFKKGSSACTDPSLSCTRIILGEDETDTPLCDNPPCDESNNNQASDGEKKPKSDTYNRKPNKAYADCEEFAEDMGKKAPECTGTEQCTYGTPYLINDRTCCLSGRCAEETEATCAEIANGRTYNFIDPEILACDLTYDSSDAPTDFVCCIGDYDYKFSEDNLDTVFSTDKSFLCYQSLGNKPYFAECCSETSCQNEEMWTGHQALDGTQPDNLRLYSAGSELNTVLSFDVDDGNGFFNYFLEYQVDDKDGDFIFKSDKLKLSEETRDWSGYNTLTFDIYYSDNYFPEKLYLVFDDDSTKSFAIKDYVMFKSFPADVWNRVSIPIGTISKPVTKLQIGLSEIKDVSSSSVYLGLNNFALNNDDTPLRYCSGSTKSWVSDLTVESTEHLEDYAPQMFACNGQYTYGWTGTKCCGEASTSLEINTFSQAQFYTDTQGGCWGGFAISPSQTVSEVINEAYWPNILYAKEYSTDTREQFLSCNIDVGTITGVDDTIDIKTIEPGSIIDNWYCDESSEWLNIGSLASTKTLAAELYSMAEGDFDFYCGPFDTLASNTALLSLNTVSDSFLTADYAESACILKNYAPDGSIDNLIVGLSLLEPAYQDVFTMLIAGTMPYIDEKTDETTIDCSAPPALGETFTTCSVTGWTNSDVAFSASYSAQYDAFIMSMEPVVETNAFRDSWISVKNFFSKFFGTEDEPPRINEKFITEADFDKLYLSKRGSSLITGVLEETEGIYSARIDYDNFDVNVEPLMKFSDLPQENVQYLELGDTQTLFITTEEEFDWRPFTSALRVATS